MAIKEDALIESKALRESVINRVDILDKVKSIALLPGSVNTTIELTANYYEVGKEAINSIVKIHREELENDGLRVLKGNKLKSLKDSGLIPKNTAHFTIVTRRALLRIGMILQDSIIAKKVRTYLLDVEEVTREKSPEIINEAVVKQNLKEIELKAMRAETAKKNAAIRQAKLMFQFTKEYQHKLSPESVTVLINAATTVLTGEPLLPPPVIDKTYTAEQIGKELGITSVMVGRIANKHGLKTAQFGMTILGQSRYSTKQVPQWVYNEAGRVAVIEAVEKEAMNK